MPELDSQMKVAFPVIIKFTITDSATDVTISVQKKKKNRYKRF